MTHDEAVRKLRRLPVDDPEVAHIEADLILLRYLRHHGAAEIAEAWEDAAYMRIGFWYA